MSNSNFVADYIGLQHSQPMASSLIDWCVCVCVRAYTWGLKPKLLALHAFSSILYFSKLLQNF